MHSDISSIADGIAARDAYLTSDWHQIPFAPLNEVSLTDDEDLKEALEKRLDEEARAICAKPEPSSDDLVARAAIAMRWCGEEISDPMSEEVALASLVRGILDLAGLRFDAQGRLL